MSTLNAIVNDHFSISKSLLTLISKGMANIVQHIGNANPTFMPTLLSDLREVTDTTQRKKYLATLNDIKNDNFAITKSLLNLLILKQDNSEQISQLASLVNSEEQICQLALSKMIAEFTIAGPKITNEAFTDDRFLEDIAYNLPELLPYALSALSEIDSAELFKIIDGYGPCGHHFIDIITDPRNIHLLSNITSQIGEFTPKQLMKLKSEAWDNNAPADTTAANTSFIQRLLDAATNLDQDTAQHQNAQKAASNVLQDIFSESKDIEDIYKILKSTKPTLNFNEINTLIENTPEGEKKFNKLAQCMKNFTMLQIGAALKTTSNIFETKGTDVITMIGTLTGHTDSTGPTQQAKKQRIHSGSKKSREKEITIVKKTLARIKGHGVTVEFNQQTKSGGDQ